MAAGPTADAVEVRGLVSGAAAAEAAAAAGEGWGAEGGVGG